MTRETRIGLLVGLAFIVTFGLVLSELTGVAGPSSAARTTEVALAELEQPGWSPVIEPLPIAAAEPRKPKARRVAVRTGQQPQQPVRLAATNAQPLRSQAKQTPEMDLDQLRRYFAVSAADRQTCRPSGRAYVVREGDNLSKIARRTLNDGSRSAVMKIYDANRDKLSSPDMLPVGVELRIPS